MTHVKVLAAMFDGPEPEVVLAQVDGALHFLARREGWAADSGGPHPDFIVDSAVAKHGFEPVEPPIEVEVLQLSDLEEVLPERLKAGDRQVYE